MRLEWSPHPVPTWLSSRLVPRPHPMPVPVVGARASKKRLRKSLRSADTGAMQQYCVQCLSEVLANGRQSPAGELLCISCHTALWGPGASDELRLLVERHSAVPNGNGSVVAQRA